jgi:predicted  nucleic acid-binding Zn-ribbon protein
MCRVVQPERENTAADEPENIVPVYLRRLDSKMDLVLDDLRELKVRMTATEEAVGRLDRHIDRVERRLDRIENRLKRKCR